MASLGAGPVGRALARLEDAGLVERASDGTLVLLEQAFAPRLGPHGRAERPRSRRPARR